MQFYYHHCLLKRLFQCVFFNMFSKVRCLHVFTFGLTLILHWSPCLFRAGTLLCHGSVIKFATDYADSSSTVLLFSSALTIKVFCASLWIRWFNLGVLRSCVESVDCFLVVYIHFSSLWVWQIFPFSDVFFSFLRDFCTVFIVESFPFLC